MSGPANVAIVRGDSGGLGHLTRDVALHASFDRWLIVDVEPRREPWVLGPEDQALAEAQVEARWVNLADLGERRLLDWLLDDAGTLWTAETFYDPRVLGAALRRGVRPALYAMPELTGVMPDVDVRYPTDWLLPEGGRVLPLPDPEPLSWERRPVRRREGPVRVLHVCGPAMLDRQGTEPFMQGLVAADVEVEVVVVGAPGPLPSRVGRASVVDAGQVPERWGLYDDVDVLVQPRRYGGLSMPVVEALAVGVDVITSDWEAYAGRAAVTVPTVEGRVIRMKGGTVTLRDPDPAGVAEALQAYVTGVGGWRSGEGAGWSGWSGPVGNTFRAWALGA